MADSTPPTGGSQAPASPPKMGRGSLVWWGYLANYVLLGLAALMIADLLWEAIDSGVWKWYRFGLPLMFTAMAIANFGLMHARERKRAEVRVESRGGAVV
jgi:hypothetical protein